MKRSDLAKLSTEAFLDYLESQLPEQSWSLADQLELEHRGYEILTSRPALQAAFEEQRRIRQEVTGKALAPLMESLEKFRSSAAQAFPPIKMTGWEVSLPTYLDDESLSRIRANSPQAQNLEAVLHQNELLKAINTGIANLVASGLTPRRQSVLFWAGITAALTGIISVALQGVFR